MGLQGLTCRKVSAVDAGGAVGTADAVDTKFTFGDEAQLRAQFWRLTKAGRPVVSSFDHRQHYGSSLAIDAVHVTRDAPVGKQIRNASMNGAGDLHVKFEEDLALEVFNFTSFEVWELSFPDGTVEYSNYAV